jgi:hypothetical protein
MEGKRFIIVGDLPSLSQLWDDFKPVVLLYQGMKQKLLDAGCV